MNKSPCMNCTERKEKGLYCHDSCNKFIEYRKKMDEVKDKKRRESELIGYEINNVYKFKKARNLPQYR